MGSQTLEREVHAEIARGADHPDFFSTRPTGELQATLRDTPTLGIETLLNTGAVRVDFDRGWIHRDAFWKGSFAKDSLLGGDLGDLARTFTGGSFWKRFDSLRDGVATGYVVNYELAALPGLPEVRAVPYPDDRRRYFRQGDTALLLSYLNDPYRLVYDTIKVIDAQNAIGVMHLGTFPTGVEVATFVLARHNYPFVNMSIPDHESFWDHARAAVPSPEELVRSRWEGHLILLRTPDISLLNQWSPVLFRAGFQLREGHLVADCHAGTFPFLRDMNSATLGEEMRMIGADTLLARWPAKSLAPEVSSALTRLVHEGSEPARFHFVLARQA